MLIELSNIRIGKKAVIINNPKHRRFTEMGIIKGVTITRVKQAPLGGTCVYNVLGYNVVIADRDANSLLCEYVKEY